MITVKRGKETTEVELDGKFSDLMLESISVVVSIHSYIVENSEHPEEIIFHYVNLLIDAAWGKE